MDQYKLRCPIASETASGIAEPPALCKITYRVASVWGCLSAADLRARVGLGAAPRLEERWLKLAGVDGERAGGGVVLGAGNSGEGRDGDEQGGAEHGGWSGRGGCGGGGRDNGCLEKNLTSAGPRVSRTSETIGRSGGASGVLVLAVVMVTARLTFNWSLL